MRERAQWRVPEWFPEIDAERRDALRLYHRELIRFNQRINLISKSSEIEADLEHFSDSILGGRHVLDNIGKLDIEVFDIGSGNGFPGLVMSTVNPMTKFVLVESDQRKAEFLKFMIGELGLRNVRLEVKRVEELPLGSIEFAVSRGFAELSKSLLICRKVFSLGGTYYHFKGSAWMREVARVPSQICAFWTPRLVKEYTLPVGNAELAIVAALRI